MNKVVSSAPGKFVILGEHAVVYGKPAIALAIDRRFTMKIKKSDVFKLNNDYSDFSNSPHLKFISKNYSMSPVSVFIDKKIPASSGLGSSSAMSVAFSSAMKALSGENVSPEKIAKESFEAELFVQGNGSPMDVSASTHGYGIALNLPNKQEDHLWDISNGERTWSVSKIDVPKMKFVVGYTGIKAPTGPLVNKVQKYKEKNSFASDIVDSIGNLTEEGMKLLEKNDVVKLGQLMTENHKLLSILGVSCNELNKLVDVTLPYSYGAKLTGSGGGGSMIALTDQPDKVSEAIASRGGIPFVVNTGVKGVTVETIED